MKRCKRCIELFLYCWLLIISLTSCIYDDYSSCPPKDGRRLVRINVDWRLFDKEVPTGMTVMEGTEKVSIFKDQNGKCLRFITSPSTNRLSKAMLDRKRRVKLRFLRH